MGALQSIQALAPAPARAPAAAPLHAAAQVHAVRCEADFAALAMEWNALHAEAGGGDASAWRTLFEWWRRHRAGRALRTFAVRLEGRLAGVLPLYVETERVLGREVRIVRLLGLPGHGGQALLADGPESRGAAQALAAAALAPRDCDVVRLAALDGASFLPKALAETAVRLAGVSAHSATVVGEPGLRVFTATYDTPGARAWRLARLARVVS